MWLEKLRRSYSSNPNESSFSLNSGEAWWESNKPGAGGQVQPKRGYFPVPPTDRLHNLRNQFVLALEKAGVQMEIHHHEVAVAQCEMGMRFDTLTRMADNLLLYKYIVKSVSRQNGKTATFMPKPLFGDNGSGMHVHNSLWKDGKNIFFDEKGYAGLSQTAIYYIGGLLKHAPALLALTSPSTNSFRRLVPGYEAPVNIAYSQRNRSAICRIPVTKSNKAKRVEFRAPDATSNPYLAFSAILMAGLDGIINKIDPGSAQDKDLYELPATEKKLIKQVPSSLGDVLNALEADHDFLLKGNVFTPDFLESYISLKRSQEVDPIRLRPTPHEFVMYYDA
jgi:glutamine synthetase